MPTTPTPQVVVITGASSGIGRATAHAFAKRGARVGLLARGQAGLDAAADEVRALGGEALVVPTDVADASQVEAAAAAVEQHFGPIDVWVNNAMATVFARFIDTQPDEFKRATEVTYLGAVYGTMAALKRMSAARSRHDRAGRLRAGLPRDPAAGRLLRRQVRDPRLHRLDPHRAARRQAATSGSPWCSCPASTPPSSTGVAPSCPTIRSRSRRSTSPRSPPKPSTGPPSTVAASCGSATARCRRSSATSSPPHWPTGYLARTGDHRTTGRRHAGRRRPPRQPVRARRGQGRHARHLRRPSQDPQPAAVGGDAPTRGRRRAGRRRARSRGVLRATR